MTLCHLVRTAEMESLQPCKQGWREDPGLTAVQQDALDDRLPKFSAHAWGSALTIEDFYNLFPTGECLSQLGTYRVCVVIVHTEHATEVSEYLDTLQHIIFDIELAPECQCRAYTLVPVKFSLLPLPEVYQLLMPPVAGVGLDPT